MATILVIDYQASLRALLRAILETEGHEVVEGANGRSGLALYRDQPTDLVITDIQIPVNGLELIVELTKSFLNVKVIAMSFGQRDSPVFETARLLGARQILRKPFTTEELLSIVRDELGDLSGIISKGADLEGVRATYGGKVSLETQYSHHR